MVVRHDAPSGSWIFVCMHSRRLEPAAGGTPMKTYEPEREILYAPGFVINAGGIFHYPGLERPGWNEDELERSLVRIGETLRDVFARSDADGVSTERAAEERARARLDDAG